MTSDEIRAFIRRFIELWQHDDARALAACYAEHAHVDSPMFRSLNGRDAIEKSFVDLFGAMGDSQIHIDEIIIDHESGDRCVTVWTSQSTHKGMLFGVPSTNRRVEVRGVFIMRFENGLIASELRLYDFVGMLVQVGVLKTKSV